MTSALQPSSPQQLSDAIVQSRSGSIRLVGGQTWADDSLADDALADDALADDALADEAFVDEAFDNDPKGDAPRDGQLENACQTVSMTGMDRIIEYAADDMTITVEAGVRWQHLVATLAEKNQELPFDCVPDASTIGGAIARDASGPMCWSSGRWRDRVLGIQAVDGSGRVFRSGGRVVKNVAGYDLSKLMIGSFGTLAALTEATLKVQPALPRATATISTPDLSLATEIAAEVVSGRQTLAAVEVVSEGSTWVVRATTTGTRCAASLDQCLSTWSGGNTTEAIDSPCKPLASAERWSQPEAKIYVPFSKWTASMAAALAAIAKPANEVQVASSLGGPIRVIGIAGLNAETASRFDEIANAAGGYVSYVGIETPSTTVNDRASDRIASRLRDVFDPAHRLSTRYAPT